MGGPAMEGVPSRVGFRSALSWRIEVLENSDLIPFYSSPLNVCRTQIYFSV